MRVINMSARKLAVRALTLIAIYCATTSQLVCAQYIHFMVLNSEKDNLRYISSDAFEREKGNIVLCGYQGDAQWLVKQQDTRSCLHELPSLAAVDLVQHKITREELKYVASLDNVEALSIGIAPEGVEVTADALNTLQDMNGLRFLNLCIHDLSNEHLKFLDKCKAVSALTIETASEHQSKQRNSLNEPKGVGELSDSSAEYIAAAKSLEALDIRLNRSLSDQFVAPLSKLPKLQKLSIDSPLLTDEALRLIAQKLQLENLSISSAKFTDEGVAKWLIQANSLRHLEIQSPNLTQKSVDALRRMGLETLTVNDRCVIREKTNNTKKGAKQETGAGKASG